MTRVPEGRREMIRFYLHGQLVLGVGAFKQAIETHSAMVDKDVL